MQVVEIDAIGLPCTEIAGCLSLAPDAGMGAMRPKAGAPCP